MKHNKGCFIETIQGISAYFTAVEFSHKGYSYLGCVHNWCLSTGAWAPATAQSSIEFRHWVLQVLKYH